MEDLRSLYKLKIAALLHDPPSKPWLIIKGRKHEDRTIDIIKKLVGFEEIPSEVRKADRLASSIDRYVLSIFMGEEYVASFLPVKTLKLKNTINPLFEVEVLEELNDVAEESYWKKLEIINKVNDLKLKYLLLYGLYELLWIYSKLPVGPADTRVPTHTVFDHNYATATALNWVGGEGFLVGIDIAGVQDYVRSSRKVRDAWASSYIVSTLLWYTILPFVSNLGPDIVVMPSLRLNPIFHHWLYEVVVMRLEHIDEVKEEVKNVEELIYLNEDIKKMYEELRIPPYATLPERAVLVLPSKQLVAEALSSDVREELDIEKELKDRFTKGWRILWKASRKLAKEKAQRDLCWKFIDNVFEEYERSFRNSRFDEIPPLTLRVEYIPVQVGRQELWRLYDDAYRELLKKMELRKYRRLDPAAELNITLLTESAFSNSIGYPRRSRRGFEYCTSCGVLPAIMVLPVGEGEELEEVLKSRPELENLKRVFTPGERLCPWCFLKRVISLEPGLLNVLLLGIDEGEVDSFVEGLLGRESLLGFPSVSDIASLRLKEKLTERMNDIVRDVEKTMLVEDLQLLKAAARRLRTIWPVERYLMEKVEIAPLDDVEKEILKGLLLTGPESLWLSADVEKRNKWVGLLRRFNLSEYDWRYYAVLVADGDSIGELVEGKPSAFYPISKQKEMEVSRQMREFLSKLLEASGEGDFRELLKTICKCAEVDVRGSAEGRQCLLDAWVSMLSNKLGQLPEDVMSRLEKVISLIKQILSATTIPVSFSYHTALSAALARQALLDAALITSLGGFVVYAGGDDLLAFLPLNSSLRAVYASRRLFAGASLQGSSKLLGQYVESSRGFIKLKNAYLSALPGVNKSFCVYVTHYIYPLQTALHNAREALKTSKNFMVVKIWLNKRMEELYKDFLVVVYSPRGGMEVTALPLSLSRVVHSVLNSSLNLQEYLNGLSSSVLASDGLMRVLTPLTDKPVYSASLLYDAEEVEELILKAVEKFKPEGEYVDVVIYKLIEKLLQRNLIRERVRDSKIMWVELENLLQSELWRIPLLINWVGGVGSDSEVRKWHLLTSLIRSTRLIRGGMRA